MVGRGGQSGILGQLFKQGWGVVLDALYPPSCLLCGAETHKAGLICSGCFVRVTPVSAPFCKKCGTPQPSAAYLNSQGACAVCERHPPMWSQARAAFVYDKAIRELILQLKYADRQENASFLGEHMARAGQGFIHLESIITPVPAHKRRLRQRRYNQAALLAQVIARKRAAHYVPDMLERTRATTRLSGFSRRERYEEMKEAIKVRPHMLRRVAGRHIVLVDDLLTTGATASVSAQALLENGAASVCLLVAALVPMQKEIDLDSPIAETA